MATTVKIGGADATSVSVASATSLTCVVPAGTGTKDVVVTTTGGSATAAGGYTYQPAGPTITSTVPAEIPANTQVRAQVIGADYVAGNTTTYRAQLDTGAGTTVLKAALPPASNGTATGFFFDVPNGVGSSGGVIPVGTVMDVAVLLTAGSVEVARKVDTFTATAAPTPAVTGVSPASVAPGAGRVFTVTGTGFTPRTGNAGVRWTLLLFPTGTTSGGISLNSSGDVTTTSFTTVASTSTLVAGTWDAYAVAGSGASASNLTTYASAKWSGTIVVA